MFQTKRQKTCEDIWIDAGHKTAFASRSSTEQNNCILSPVNAKGTYISKSYRDHICSSMGHKYGFNFFLLVKHQNLFKSKWSQSDKWQQFPLLQISIDRPLLEINKWKAVTASWLHHPTSLEIVPSLSPTTLPDFCYSLQTFICSACFLVTWLLICLTH